MLSTSLSKTIFRGVHSMPSRSLSALCVPLPQRSKSCDTDVLVIGCGVAGSSAALVAAQRGCNVTMISSAPDPRDCNSFWAQGGIIYKANDDTPELLADDVHIAGAGLSYNPAVMKMATHGPNLVEELLLELAKVPFDRKEDGSLSLCLEASHNRARIIHWRDQTGAAITQCLQREVMNHPRIDFRSGTTAIDLITHGPSSGDNACEGVYCLDNGSGEVYTIRSGATVLATGGLGEIYRHTSNPTSARGDGFAIAHRAGARLLNMEYVQFHPTTLALPGQRSFLLTEALRGEGAILRNDAGEAFAKRYHPAGELAPRDVVARLILAEMQRTQQPHVFLDISHREPEWLRSRFPTIYKHALEAGGLDFTRQPLPVVPAAHYFCGGVGVDLHGRTSLRGLSAAGEVSCTGVHGANRLASTSLLEALVWGAAIAEDVVAQQKSGLGQQSREEWDAAAASRCGTVSTVRPGMVGVHNFGGLNHALMSGTGLSATPPAFQPPAAASSSSSSPSSHPPSACGPFAPGPLSPDLVAAETARLWPLVQGVMWEGVGIQRHRAGLEHACAELAGLQMAAEQLYASSPPSVATIGLRNGATTARLVAEAALANGRSVGTHFRLDSVSESDAKLAAN